MSKISKFSNTTSDLQILKQSIFVLHMKQNFALLNPNDKKKLQKIKNILDLSLFSGLSVFSLSYYILNKFLFKKRIFLLDFANIILLSYSCAKAHEYFLYKRIANDTIDLQKRNRFILKNSILNHKHEQTIHEFTNLQIYFTYSLWIKLILKF